MYKRQVSSLLIGLIFFLSGTAMAEVVYVIDQLRLGVRANPDPAESSIAVVTTGDALTVLGREGDYIRIRTKEGTEGWVSQGYVSPEQPAQLRLAQLQTKYAEIEKQVGELRETLTESRERGEAMALRIEELVAEKSSQQQKIEELTGSADGFRRQYAWVFQSAIAMALFLGGFALGIAWYKRRVRTRLGGMEI